VIFTLMEFTAFVFYVVDHSWQHSMYEYHFSATQQGNFFFFEC